MPVRPGILRDALALCTACAVELWVQPAKIGSPARGDFDGDLDHAVRLGFGESGGFAGGAAGDEKRDALGQLGFDERTERSLVE